MGVKIKKYDIKIGTYSNITSTTAEKIHWIISKYY